MGMPGIRKCDEIKVKVGNQQYEIVMHWVDTRLGLGIPGYCENGVHYWLWHTPRIKEKLVEGVVWFAINVTCASTAVLSGNPSS